jgi:hypothetical protein
LSRTSSYEASNRTAAEAILADIERHGGPESLAVQWAKLWMENHSSAQRELFEEAA